MPKVTVLMPVYNGEAFLEEAVNSVLRQSFRDFELLIMDDGSTDRTPDIVNRYKDVRIRLERRQHDFIGNLNEGIRLAQGKYIARMDADDIMHSERLRVQVGFMEKNPEFAVCGCWMKNFGEGIVPGIIRSFHGEIIQPLVQMLKGNILFHPTLVFRKDFVMRNHIRYEDYPCAEDYKFYLEMARKGGNFYVEPQVLLFYRNSKQQVTFTRKQEMEETSRRVRTEAVGVLLERYPDEKVKNLVNALLEAETQGILSSESLKKILFEVFYKVAVTTR